MRFVDRVAVVTGGGSGIGRATVSRLAREGAKVVIADIDEDGSNETVRIARDCGAEATSVPTDVGSEQDVRALIDYVSDRYGALHVLVNNAGTWMSGSDASVTDLASDVWARNLSTNLTSVYLMCKHSIPLMRKSQRGAIVNVASVAALAGWKNMDAYTASKGGVVSLTRSMAVEYAPAVRINVVCPGSVRTALTSVAQDAHGYPSTPMGRVGQPEELASAIVYLASDDAAYVTGEVHVVDGGRVSRQ